MVGRSRRSAAGRPYPWIVELSVSKKGNKSGAKENKKNTAEIRKEMDKPWIAMRSGVILIALTSIGLAALVAWQSYPNVDDLFG
jgi:hypothetical protein